MAPLAAPNARLSPTSSRQHSSLAVCSRSSATPQRSSSSARITQQRIRSTSSSTTTTTALLEQSQQQQQSRTATVQVDLGYAVEQAVVSLQHPNARLVEATMAFPLGLVLESVDGEVAVTEVTPGSAAEVAGCRVGDVVRATTAFTMQMTFPTMNLLLGGGGRPRLMKVLVPTDKVPAFSKVMDAVRSNTADQGGDGRVTLVLERVEAGDGGGGSSSGDGSSSGGAEGGAAAEGPVFDPRIFNSTFE